MTRREDQVDEQPGEPKELNDVLREERSRGRRPVNTDAEREQRALLEGYRTLISGDDEEKFCEGLIALGYQRDSERFRHFLAVWRTLKRSRPRA
jgi:hypothetical protein